ncbi:MAG: hypothetical protein RMJ19_12410 [Gemmatales bacterium]|nr:hypothetical protein [Gemmatales bacterium]MDW8176468.1 hypothetical protein [Gemmatales bacterium]
MRRKRIFVMGWLVVVLSVGRLVLGEDASVSLLVQQALREAQACLQRGECSTAVRVLERELPHINGNAAYLDLLAQAYDRHLAELHRLGRRDLIPTYLERLAILNPARAEALRREWHLGEVSKPALRIVARGRLEDESPPPYPVRVESWSQLADDAFAQGHYQQARLCYWRAAESRQTLSTLQQQRWAYCSWWEISQLLQASPMSCCHWSVAVLEGRAAIQRSSEWAFAQQLLQELERRQLEQPVVIRHLPSGAEGWQVAVSAHFRIHHHNAPLAEQVLRCAEQVHALNAWFWFGELAPAPWEHPCEIYLYQDATSFSRATGVAPSVPGFSTLVTDTTDARRVLSRRMDLRADIPDLLSRLVPHETTHVSLAGRFGARPLPRWADEALALLAEPEEARQFYREKVFTAPRDQLLSPDKLLTWEGAATHVEAHLFYGQSLLLVEWLLARRGKWQFVQFLAEAPRLGWEPALKRYYGINSLLDLEPIFQPGNKSSSAFPIALPVQLAGYASKRQTHTLVSWNR